MRICYFSDLHLEHYDYEKPLPEGDVLLLAGDICRAVDLRDWKNNAERSQRRDHALWFFDEISERFKRVIYCIGNHEHLDFDFYETCHALKTELSGAVHILEKDYLEYENTIFYGATLWTDFDSGNLQSMESAQSRMPEYKYVRVGQALLMPENVMKDHFLALRNLSYVSKRYPDYPVIVLTHHSPSLQGLSKAIHNPTLQGAFASDLDKFIIQHENIRHWIFGHTHIQTSFQIGQCHLATNGRGYQDIDAHAHQFDPGKAFDFSFKKPLNNSISTVKS